MVVRLADEPLCSDGLANAPISRCSEESTVSVHHWCSRSIRAATGFADRKNRRRRNPPVKAGFQLRIEGETAPATEEAEAV